MPEEPDLSFVIWVRAKLNDPNDIETVNNLPTAEKMKLRAEFDKTRTTPTDSGENVKSRPNWGVP